MNSWPEVMLESHDNMIDRGAPKKQKAVAIDGDVVHKYVEHFTQRLD